MEDDSASSIWKPFCSALGAEYRESKEIIGSSGLTHSVQAIGVDDKSKRVIIVSAEHNPRVAALMRVDVQATMPNVRVLVARPIAVDFAAAARLLFHTEDGMLDFGKLLEFGSLLTDKSADKNGLVDRFGHVLMPLAGAIARTGLPIRTNVLNAIEQVTALDWRQIVGGEQREVIPLLLNLVERLHHIDNLAEDRQQGICPVPTYQFTETDWELFQRGKEQDVIQERLKALNIYQYFFPPRDALALGLIEGGLGSTEDIQKGFQIAEQDGHQLVANELVRDASSIIEIIEALASLGYVANVGLEHELTDAGKKQRVDVKISPREGLVEKLIGRFNFDVSIKLSDLWKFPGSGA